MLVKNLFGHEYIVKDIMKMLHKNILHNSIIFSGKKGIGKYSYVLNLVKFILSHEIDNLKTINDFSIDTKIDTFVNNNTCSNLLLITPEFDVKKQNFKNLISVDKIRKINEFLQKTGSDNYYKIVIIDALDNLNINATNALLKNLEEPSKNTLFFLISHSYNNLLDTVKSRCVNLVFKDLSKKDMLNILDSTNISYIDKEIDNVINLANGSYANLLWYLEDSNFKLYLAILKLFNKSSQNIEIYNLINEVKSKEDIDYKSIFNIIKNLLISYINPNNIDEITSMLEEVNYFDIVAEKLHLDKSTILLNIFFKIKALQQINN